MSHRVEKVAAQLREELSAILAREVKDPRVQRVGVLGVEVSADLSFARVHVSTIGDDDERRGMMEALGHARGFIRHELAERLKSNFRRVPEIRFIDDRNTEYAVHISKMLEEILPAGGGEEPDEG
ncbi:MAG: 30S ribosome-binding factor RbfA [Candidatus Dormibacteria bacterium]